MTQTETPPETTPDNCGGARRTMCLVWVILGLFLLILAAAGALVKCPWLFPAAHTQTVSDNADLEQRVRILEGKVANLAITPSTPQAGAVDSDTTNFVKNLQSQVETLQKQNDDVQKAARKLVVSALAYWELREAVSQGQNFTAALANLRTVADGDLAITEQIVKLEPYAANPPPSLLQLHDHLVAKETTITSTATSNEKASWWERANALLQPLISVRPLHDPRFAALEAALVAGDASAASTAYKALPDDVQKKLESIGTVLDAHTTIDDSLNALQKILEGTT